MKNVYEFCPSFEDERYLIRKLERTDLDDLLAIYSDKNAVPFFNSDNCHGDDFYYTTKERVGQAIDFWEEAYSKGWFVRWSVVDKVQNAVIGTIEAFHRDADDYFTNTGLVRLDLRSDYEQQACIVEIMRLIEKDFFDLFYCEKLATKGFSNATGRIAALKEVGWQKSESPLVGGYDTYFDYWVKQR